MPSLLDERAAVHARLVQARGDGLPGDHRPPQAILDSWARCAEAGLDCHRAPAPRVVEAAELRQRREAQAPARRLAMAELETLFQQIAGSSFLLAYADRDGVILDLRADERFRSSGTAAGIVEGSCWAESLAGTNGLGTALAGQRPVAVNGPEHWFLDFAALSCTAAPVRDARGDIVGVLDASSCFESRQRHTQALVQMAAIHIENGLLTHQMRQHLVLAIHPRPEYLGTLSAGLLAFDEAGRLVAANARGRQLLQGLQTCPGTPFEALFGERFEHLLARLNRGGELRLRDVMGSAMVAGCVNRPPRTLPRAPQRSAVPAPGSSLAVAAWSAAPPVATDAAVDDAYRLAEGAVRMGVPVLIHGETGTGKEVLARHLHAHSGRRGAFVPVNCGALPAGLIEAELFGYSGGAFTGARREGSPGLIASADGGTLLLDEVAELPLPLQAALLRFLDDQVVRPVGGAAGRKVDVQLLAASHADLADAVAARRFRADLMYRLNTVRVALPPLRLRRDLAGVARQMLNSLAPGATLDEAALARLARHDWPGNFRELRAVLTRALLARGGGAVRLGIADLDAVMPARPLTVPAEASALQQGASELVRREFERTGHSVSQTSRNLGISRTTVYRHLRGAGLAPGAAGVAGVARGGRGLGHDGAFLSHPDPHHGDMR